MRERDFTLTAELPLEAATTSARLYADLDVLRNVVDAVQVTDNPDGIPHPSPLLAARLCIERGVDAVMHLSGRDRNRIALQSELLGAGAAGVTSLLVMRGNRLPEDFTPRAKRVFELGAKRLLRAASLIGSEERLEPLGGFYLGSAARVIAPSPDWEPQGIRTKAQVGCKFVQTQPLLDVERLRAWMRRLVASRVIEQVSVVVSVPLLATVDSLAAAGGLLLPQGLRARLERLEPAGLRREGIALCAETLAALTTVPGVAGANLVAFRDVECAVEAISLSGIRDGG